MMMSIFGTFIGNYVVHLKVFYTERLSLKTFNSLHRIHMLGEIP